jgi:membrane protein implicated in regulation of membrane protease activity
MSPQLQTVLALALVALAAAWLGWRWFAKRKSPGCGGECGCPAVATKSKLAKLGRSASR